MGRDTLEAVVRWQAGLGGREPLEITFHGGEPLVPGASFYRMALPLLKDGLGPREVHFGIQSNLWRLTDELCELFSEYGVSIGTSLDGPEPINDAQRGAGYFRRTMAGIERARTHGLQAGCICTFTAQSAPRAGEVFDFFAGEGLDFSIHAALPPLGRSGAGWALSPQAHSQLLVELLDRYLDNLDTVRISTLDALMQSVSAGRGRICTFGDCLGDYLAVDPEGWIYPCQRFAGMQEYRLGNVRDGPGAAALAEAPAWQALDRRQRRINEECGDCPYLALCRGGCPYNALAATGGSLDGSARDPHCPAYRRVLGTITDRALEEVFSEENITAIVEEGPGRYGLLRKGRMLRIMRGAPHPQEVARRARGLVGAAALGVSASPEEALRKLDRVELITQPQLALQSLTSLRKRLDAQSQQGLVNAYVHVTYGCSLSCTHCYARSGTGRSPAMAVEDIAQVVQQVAAAGFRKAVITGGEPLVHPRRDDLLDALAALQTEVKPLQTVLRTNLSDHLTHTLIDRLARSTDQVVVSVDGDEASHDARRGAGAYARTVGNLRALLARTVEAPTSGETRPARVGITAALTAEQMGGPAEDSVRALADELDVPLRIKSVLPLGRGADLGLAPAFYTSLADCAEAIAYGVRPAATCGLGMNLYVGPGGECYPCYAVMEERHALGNVFHDGLGPVLERNDAYRRVTVETNRQCRHCGLRYICGGFCRAWGATDDPDGPPVDCSALQERANRLLAGALGALEVSSERWRAAGLPVPPSLPEARSRSAPRH